jgi:hypothetical protein
MAFARLVTSASPRGLLDAALQEICTSPLEEGWCVVASRSHLLREVHRILVESCPERAWIGFRAMSLDELLSHYARDLDPAQSLTSLQVRQVVARCIREVHLESEGEAFRGQVFEGRVSESTLRSLTHLFAEIEQYGLGPADLETRLLEGPSSVSMSRRAHQVVAVYRRYREKLRAHRLDGPRRREMDAADRACAAAPPAGVRRFLFLGMDGSSWSDPGLRLAEALTRNPDVGEVRLALVLPDSLEAEPWATHGNETAYRYWVEEVGRRDILERRAPPPGMPADLLAVVDAPFDYQDSVRATGAVHAWQLPDRMAEAEWVASDIKLAILDGVCRPDDVAVVARDMDRRAEDLEDVFHTMGLPLVSSRETPCCDVPAVRALLAVMRLEAFGWRTRDVVAVAESPYLPLSLNPTLLARLGSVGTLPEGENDWRKRIDDLCQVEIAPGRHAAGSLPAGLVEGAAALRESFGRFTADLAQLFELGMERTPSRWVRALLEAVRHWKVEAALYAMSDELEPDERARMARTDLDGLNALLRALDDWLRGREVAGMAGETMDARLWYAELEAVASATRIRSSSYPLSAVHLLTPQQAGLRSFRRVYLIGLTDGVWPAGRGAGAYALTEDERRALHLPDDAARAAGERLLFHMAVASATESVILTTPALDDRGKVLVPSPFLSCLGLRIDGFSVHVVRARSLGPDDPQGVLSPVHLDWVAAQACLSLAQAADGGIEGILSAVESDPLVSAWLSNPGPRRAAEGWTVEKVRAETALVRSEPYARFAPFRGEVGPELLPASLTSEDAAFSPSELERLGSCGWRFLATRGMGLFAGRSDQDEDPNEAGAFGTLQHRVLERLYQDLAAEGRFPPQATEDVEEALDRLVRIGHEAIREHAVTHHEQLWTLDLDFVLDVLRRFVRRDLESLRATYLDPMSLSPQTRLLALEARLRRDQAVSVERNGVRFRLFGAIDRVEEIDDSRLPAALQGWLVLRDYKSSRDSPWKSRIDRFLDGSAMQLPLYSVLAEQRWGRRVYSLGEKKIALEADPEELSAGILMPESDGSIRMKRHPRADKRSTAPEDKRNLVVGAQEAALSIAAERVSQVRAGRFDPPEGRQCWGCHLSELCRASRFDNPERGRERAQMPLAISLEEMDALLASRL